MSAFVSIYRRLALIAFGMGLFAFSLILQAAAPLPVFSVGPCTTPPVLNGRLDDSCWQHSLEMSGFAVPGTHALAQAQTHVFFTRDDAHLFIAIRADQLDMDDLQPASRTHDDPDMWRNDCVELFFDRNQDQTTFYQLMINRLGTIYDARCDTQASREERNDLAWESSARCVAGADDTGWMLELAIPWAALGGPVAPGDSWRMNVVRDNASDGEPSSWVPLSEHKWHVPEQFGYAHVVDRTPGCRVGYPAATADPKRFRIECLADAAATYDVSLDIPPFVHQQKRLSVSSGAPASAVLGYSSEGWKHAPTDGLSLVLAQGEQVLYRWVRHHLLPMIETTIIPLPNGDPRPRAISADWPTTFGLDTRHTFPGSQPPAQSVKVPWRLIVEAPRGIRAGDDPAVGTVERDGVLRDVYEIPFRKVHCGKNWHSFGVNTSLPAGEVHALYYYAVWEGGEQPPQKLPVRTVAVGRTEPPKRFITGFYNFYLQRLDQMETVERLRNCGLNCMSVMRVRDPAVYDRLRDMGLFMREGDYFWPGKMKGWGDWPEKDPEARNLDVNGYPTVGKSGYQLCPSYRGREFRQAMAKTRARVAESGVNWFAFDMEGYVMPAGDKGCFCDRCMQAFAVYRAEHVPDLSAMSPKQFEKRPDAHPAHHSAWIAFKDHQWAGLFRAMKREVADVVGQTCPKAGPVMSEWSFGQPWDPEAVNRTYRGWEFVRTFEWFEVSAYSGVQRFVDRQLEREALLAEHAPADVQVDWIVTPSPRRLGKPGGTGYYATDVMEHPDELKYKIFEAAAFGTKGLYLWRFADVDADTMRQWVEGIAAIADVEDLILDGRRISDVRSTNPDVGVRGMHLDGEAVLVVAEYRTDRPVETTVTYQVKEESTVRDLETDKVIATLTPQTSTFRVALFPTRRARLLHIVVPGEAYAPDIPFTLEGPAEQAAVQQPQVQNAAEVPDGHVVQFRHEAFAEMLQDGIPERGAISAHGARIGDEWVEDVWTYWYASDGDNPQEWSLKPMQWDMHTRWAKAWHGLFASHLEENSYRSPFATRDRMYMVKDEPFAPVAAVAMRNPFEQTVEVRLEGNIRIRKTEKGGALFVFVRTADGQTQSVSSTLDPDAIGWYGHKGAEKPDREYLRLNQTVSLTPGALLVFAGYIDAQTRAAVEGRNIFELFADNDRWGPMYRPRITILSE